MIRIKSTILFVSVFFSFLLYAGMENTEKCKARIKILEAKIGKIDGLCKNRDGFDMVLGIPDCLRRKKRDDIDAQMKAIGEKTELKSKIAEERDRLHTCKQIVLTRIKVDANGTWDTFAAPEIEIWIDGRKIASGGEDQAGVDFSLCEDISSCSKLEVKDRDLSGREQMGTILIQKNNVPTDGVSEDSCILTEQGTASSEDGTISYEIWYEVRY